MAGIPQDMLAEVDKARVGGGGNYINHGDYVVLIDKWHYAKIQDRCIILEVIVAEARMKIIYEGDKKVEQEPNAAGSSMSDVANFDGDGKLSAPANSRAPVLGLFDLKENVAEQAAKVSETLNYCTSEAQPARGMLMSISTFPKKIRTPKPGGPTHITGREYKCLDKPGTGANTADKVKARLDALVRGPEVFLNLCAQHIAESRAANGGASAAAPALSLVPGVSIVPSAAAVPAIPSLPTAVPAIPPIPAAVPWYVAEGWKQHPQDPRYFYKGSETKLESDLLAMRQ